MSQPLTGNMASPWHRLPMKYKDSDTSFNSITNEMICVNTTLRVIFNGTKRVLTKGGPPSWTPYIMDPSDLGKILTDRTMSKHIQTYIQTSSSHSHNYTHLIQSPTEAHTPTQTQTWCETTNGSQTGYHWNWIVSVKRKQTRQQG